VTSMQVFECIGQHGNFHSRYPCLRILYLREVCLALRTVIGYLSASGKGSRFGYCLSQGQWGKKRSPTSGVTMILTVKPKIPKMPETAIGEKSDLPAMVRSNDLSQLYTIVHFFSSVAYVWVPGGNTTGPIAKKFDFS
jgi:hypothetical protein